MRLERVSTNQIEIQVSFEELAKYGLSKEDIEKSTSRWYELFSRILEEAHSKWNVNTEGTIIVDVFRHHSHGMIVLVTFHDTEEFFIEPEDGFYLEMIEMNLPIATDIFYTFTNLEAVIQFSKRIYPYFEKGRLYFYQGQYYLWIASQDNEYDLVRTLISDYGERAHVSVVTVHEYGKIIFLENAIKNLMVYFSD